MGFALLNPSYNLPDVGKNPQSDLPGASLAPVD
jgi:hypothetical protein